MPWIKAKLVLQRKSGHHRESNKLGLEHSEP